MEFSEQLKGYDVKDLAAAFPGIPVSTAYDWLSGHREPLAYLRPCILAELARVTRKARSRGSRA